MRMRVTVYTRNKHDRVKEGTMEERYGANIPRACKTKTQPTTKTRAKTKTTTTTKVKTKTKAKTKTKTETKTKAKTPREARCLPDPTARPLRIRHPPSSAWMGGVKVRVRVRVRIRVRGQS